MSVPLNFLMERPGTLKFMSIMTGWWTDTSLERGLRDSMNCLNSSLDGSLMSDDLFMAEVSLLLPGVLCTFGVFLGVLCIIRLEDLSLITKLLSLITSLS